MNETYNIILNHRWTLGEFVILLISLKILLCLLEVICITFYFHRQQQKKKWYIEQIKLAWTHVWFFWEKHEGFTNWWIYSLRLTFWGRTFALESYSDVFVVRRLTTIPLCAFLLRKCVRNCYLTAHVKISEIASPRDDKWTARNYLPIDTHRVFKDNHVWPSAAQSVLLIGVCCFASDTVSWEV